MSHRQNAGILPACQPAQPCMQQICFHHDIYGGPSFTVETDHKPLVPLINTTNLNRVPLRCQRLLLRLMRYSPNAIHVPGKDLIVADTFSRAPSPAPESVAELSAQVEAHVLAVAEVPDLHLDRIRTATSADPDFQQMKSFIANGWPSKQSLLKPSLRPYYLIRFQLSTHNNVIYRDQRILIPASFRHRILTSIHDDGHQGIVKCCVRARQSVWWPGMSSDVDSHITQCPTCAECRPNPPEALSPSISPRLPWEKVACDLCDHNGKQFLILVDYFSRYIEVEQLSSTTYSTVIKVLDQIFSTHGIPNTVISDNGPHFDSDQFKSYAREMGFHHQTSSPRYAQSNGEAERAVQTAKNLFRKNANLAAALLAYRSTPLTNGYSPAELLFGRQVRSRLVNTPQQPAWLPGQTLSLSVGGKRLASNSKLTTTTSDTVRENCQFSQSMLQYISLTWTLPVLYPIKSHPGVTLSRRQNRLFAVIAATSDHCQHLRTTNNLLLLNNTNRNNNCLTTKSHMALAETCCLTRHQRFHHNCMELHINYLTSLALHEAAACRQPPVADHDAASEFLGGTAPKP